MLFIDNKYTRTYYKIIARAQGRVNHCYTEKHHIIPKSLGGSNSKSNLVALTAKEHFLCHRLLVKMTEGDNKVKMRRAIWAMSTARGGRTANRRLVSGIVYKQIREDYIKTVAGKPKSPAPRAKLGQYSRTKKQRKNISDMRKAQKGLQQRTPETKAKMSAWQKGVPKPKVSCEHCGKELSLMNYKRWHGTNCKFKL